MESTSSPLADYFWIAGVESIAYDDGFGSQPFEEIIAEDGEGEEADASSVIPSRAQARHSRQNSANRLSTISKLSITPSVNNEVRSVDENDGNTKSNRSSATIRPVPHPNTNTNSAANNATNGNSAASSSTSGAGIFGLGPDGFPPDFDFDKALFKFAAERENFLDDLTFSAGAKIQSRPPMVNPRTEKLKVEEGDQSGRMSPLMRSIKGSIRRKMSFREMTSVRKQPITPKAGKYPGLHC